MNTLKGYTAKNNAASRIFYTVKYISYPCQYGAIKRFLAYISRSRHFKVQSEVTFCKYSLNSFAAHIKMCICF